MFITFIAFLIVQRIAELLHAKRNEQWMKARGAFEVGKNHYKFIVLMHSLFFLSLIIEVILFEKGISAYFSFFLVLFILTQIARVWTIRSLGKYWNTKIIILPNKIAVSKGPYNYVRHPNYVIVVVEILVIPLLFNAFFTALVFSILNMIALTIRISAEERALMSRTNYRDVQKSKPRFIPIK